MVRTCHRSIYISNNNEKGTKAKQRRASKGIATLQNEGDKPTVFQKTGTRHQYLETTNLKIPSGKSSSSTENGAKTPRNIQIPIYSKKFPIYSVEGNWTQPIPKIFCLSLSLFISLFHDKPIYLCSYTAHGPKLLVTLYKTNKVCDQFLLLIIISQKLSAPFFEVMFNNLLS